MLAEAITAAAASGGTAVVQAAGTDVWGFLRTRAARLVGRGDRDRETEALDRLDRTRAALSAAADDEQRARVRDEHARLWQGEFLSLLQVLSAAEQQRAISELQSLTRDFGGSGASVRLDMSHHTFKGDTAFQNGDHNHQENNFGSRE